MGTRWVEECLKWMVENVCCGCNVIGLVPWFVSMMLISPEVGWMSGDGLHERDLDIDGDGSMCRPVLGSRCKMRPRGIGTV